MSQLDTRPAFPAFHERHSYSHQGHHIDHYSPRTFDSTSSQYFDSHYERSSWKSAQPRSPMPDYKTRSIYDVPSPRAGDNYQTRPEATQRPPREQLPPLSSIFGSSQRTGLPAPSFSDRSPTSTFPALSPRDARRTLTPGHQERSFHESSSSYLSRPVPGPQYPPQLRTEMNESGNLPPLLSSISSATPKAESPRVYDARYSPYESSRTLPSAASGSRWSPRSEVSRPEYFPSVPRDSSTSFRPTLETRNSYTQPVSNDPASSYHERSHHPPSSPHYEQSQGSHAEPSVTKDGLGPKIWTGNQFLPRFVRQAEVPGEGLCYFYDDGTHCKSVIDGEQVNAHWGVTKAGKPRKRLAIACLICREKKIKCDPDFPRCIQCDKFGRVCKFKNAPHSHGTPETSPTEADDTSTRPVSRRADAGPLKIETDFEKAEDESLRLQGRRLTPNSDAQASKRRRSGYDSYTPVTAEDDNISPRTRPAEFIWPKFEHPRTTTQAISTDSLASILHNLETDPFQTSREVVIDLMSTYFTHINSTSYSLFPRRTFMTWLLSSTSKTPDDLMLIYTMLAFASVSSPNSSYKALGPRFASISHQACTSRHFTLQLVQSRLLLSLYYFSTSQTSSAYDLCGSAIRAASFLHLHIELSGTSSSSTSGTSEVTSTAYPYNLTLPGYAECRRRTFYSCYILDLLSSSCASHIPVFSSKHIYLRLPCDVVSFEAQSRNKNPYFDHTSPPPQTPHTEGQPIIGAMGYLLHIATIFGDVMACIYHVSNWPQAQKEKLKKSDERNEFIDFYNSVVARLTAWQRSLPVGLVYAPEQIADAAHANVLGAFVTMHALYHCIVMKLNRYVPVSLLAEAELQHHVRTANEHALQALDLANDLVEWRAQDEGDSWIVPSFLGYAVVGAVDVATAKVRLDGRGEVERRCEGARCVLKETARYWGSGVELVERVGARLGELGRLRKGNAWGWEAREGVGLVRAGDGREGVVKAEEGAGEGAGKNGLWWRFKEGVEGVEGVGRGEIDAVYGVSAEVWARAVGAQA